MGDLTGNDGLLILLGGALLAAGIGGALLADRIRVPGLLLFLGLGMLAGSEGIGGIEFKDAELTRTLGTIGLVLILFEGGLTAGWKEIRPVLGTALSLATLGTIITAGLAGVAAHLIFGVDWLLAMVVGSAIAATDSAAIFAVLRGSNLERKVARTLEGESGMNDPVAQLLVIGFIEWINDPSYGFVDMAGLMVFKLAVGAAFGLMLGKLAAMAFRRIDLPTEGIYPVASMAVAALAFGLTEVVHGSGLFAVYLTALALGTGDLPARRTIVAFHQGVAWVAQIGLFFLLGLLVFPSELLDIAWKGILLSAALILVARPIAAFIGSFPGGFTNAERLMLGWAGLRGATPIWLATFPVVAGIESSVLLFDIAFFVVVTSTLIQGATFEPLARRLGLTSDEPALAPHLFESGRIRQLGSDVIACRVRPGAAAAGHPIRDLGLPRESVLNVIVREGTAIPPRGSTVINEGDELHLMVRSRYRDEVSDLMKVWHDGPIGLPTPQPLPLRGAPQIFSVRPASAGTDDPSNPSTVNGIRVASRIRSRRDRPGALVSLVDGRYAVTGTDVVAVGGRRGISDWCEGRSRRAVSDPIERSWWQEVAGALSARG